MLHSFINTLQLFSSTLMQEVTESFIGILTRISECWSNEL